MLKSLKTHIKLLKSTLSIVSFTQGLRYFKDRIMMKTNIIQSLTDAPNLKPLSNSIPHSNNSNNNSKNSSDISNNNNVNIKI